MVLQCGQCDGRRMGFDGVFTVRNIAAPSGAAEAAARIACQSWDDSAQLRAMAAFQVAGNAPQLGEKNQNSHRAAGSASSVSMRSL